jgi:putative transposase
MDYLLSEMLAYYHEERPHQGMENELLLPAKGPRRKGKKDEPPPDTLPLSQIGCRTRLGGLLKHYYRKAA